jgi:beta-hydroxylase
MKKQKEGSPLPKRSGVYRLAKNMRGVIDGLIARDSLIGNEALLSPDAFPWMEAVRGEWRAIQAEVRSLLETAPIPPLRDVSPDHRRIMRDDLWRSYFLYGYGYRVDQNCDRCPQTAALIDQIPGLNSAFFSILLPGTHIRKHRGPTKALVTCHLGLMVPDRDACRMELDGEDVHWSEGDWLVFDDTYGHQVWHNGEAPRVVLLIQVRRPLRGIGWVIARLFLFGIRRSAFVQEGRRNLAAWSGAAA